MAVANNRAMAAARSRARDRAGSLLGAVLVQGTIAAILLWGLNVSLAVSDQSQLEPVRLIDPPSAEPAEDTPSTILRDEPVERARPRKAEDGGPSHVDRPVPPTLEPAPRSAEAPVTQMTSIPEVRAENPSTATASGTGGTMDSGAGGSGGGERLGGDGGAAAEDRLSQYRGRDRSRPARHIGGTITDADYPAIPAMAGIGGTVRVVITITAHGRARDCRVARSSGNAFLDTATCELIERRYRFAPARGRDGRPVVSRVTQYHYWITRR
ncbi:energy transducer TonB [Sphingosinicella terrae]|uniref:energy transducer TonB n=1 Tax=Sphingosinicella terrae TaxID=2172047 RepID=UPI0025499C67|nr:TonB family protein [Sphingosinicella terrae]